MDSIGKYMDSVGNWKDSVGKCMDSIGNCMDSVGIWIDSVWIGVPIWICKDSVGIPWGLNTDQERVLMNSVDHLDASISRCGDVLRRRDVHRWKALSLSFPAVLESSSEDISIASYSRV